MTSSGGLPTEQYWAEFDQFSRLAKRRAAQRVERLLVAAEQRTQDAPRSAAELAETVLTARDVGVVFDDDVRSRISLALQRLLTAYGTGSAQPRAAAGGDPYLGPHLGELRALLDELGADGSPQLREQIASAAVYSRTDGGVISRGTALATALDLCRTKREYVDVSIMYAQYQVDIGAYRAAARLLAESRRVVHSEATCADLLPELAVCEAGMLFAQGRLRRARRRFQDTLAAMERLSRSDGERPAIKAYHYLGKIHSLYGRHDLAVRALVYAEERLAQRGAAGDPRQSGHNHLRLGEALNRAGSPDAQWHLSRARDLFLTAGEESSGRGQQDGISAVPGETLTKQIERYKSMLALARNNLHWRGVVIASVRLTAIYARRGEWRSALRDAREALAAGVRLIRGSGVRATVAGLAELAVAYAIRKARKLSATWRGSPPLRCCCAHCTPG